MASSRASLRNSASSLPLPGWVSSRASMPSVTVMERCPFWEASYRAVRPDIGWRRWPLVLTARPSSVQTGPVLRGQPLHDVGAQVHHAGGVRPEPRGLGRGSGRMAGELADDDACGCGARRQRKRGGAQFGQVAAADGEHANLAGLALIDVQEAAVRAEPGVNRAHPAGLAD